MTTTPTPTLEELATRTGASSEALHRTAAECARLLPIMAAVRELLVPLVDQVFTVLGIDYGLGDLKLSCADEMRIFDELEDATRRRELFELVLSISDLVAEPVS